MHTFEGFQGPLGRPDLKNASPKIKPDCLQVPNLGSPCAYDNLCTRIWPGELEEAGSLGAPEIQNFGARYKSRQIRFRGFVGGSLG